MTLDNSFLPTLILFFASTAASAIASISGFGIGSLLTPLLSMKLTTHAAIAIVSVPHFIATLIRFWILRRHVDLRLLLSFGSLSAAGSLIGAFLHTRFATPAITLVFGVILIFSAVMEIFEVSKRFRCEGRMAWIAGGISGLFGGLVGNQGGIRSAALLSFRLPKETFVATATATGILVDLARMPIYFVSGTSEIVHNLGILAISISGVVFGTFAGVRLLKNIPERKFGRVVSVLILILGLIMVGKGISSGDE